MAHLSGVLDQVAGVGVVYLLQRAKPDWARVLLSSQCWPMWSKSRQGVWFNCPLVDTFYPAEWMAETQFRTADHPP